MMQPQAEDVAKYWNTLTRGGIPRESVHEIVVQWIANHK